MTVTLTSTQLRISQKFGGNFQTTHKARQQRCKINLNYPFFLKPIGTGSHMESYGGHMTPPHPSAKSPTGA